MKVKSKLARSQKGNSCKRKVTDSEIMELDAVEKSDNDVDSYKLHKKKRKLKASNDENVSDCRILEIDALDLENNASIEIPKELHQHRKKHKHKSLDKMENLSNYSSKGSCKAENNKIFDELYKRKKHKQTDFDNTSDCLRTDLNGVELSQNNLNCETFSGVHKHKSKKRHKLVTTENSQKTANMESYQISNNTVCNEVAEESIVKNSDGQNISKLSRRNNKHSETNAENYQIKKYQSINDTNEFDCKIIEPDTSEKSNNNVNFNKLHKKKRKHKVTDGENVFECGISETVIHELENDTDIKFLKNLKKGKRKKDKHKLFDDMENVLNYQDSGMDESGKDKNLGALEVHNREDKHKQIEVDTISDCKAAEINQSNLDRENVDMFHTEKKKKCKHKIVDLMENISDCKTAKSNIIEINLSGLNNEDGNRLSKEKKKKHKHNFLDEMDTVSHYKTGELDAIEVNQINLNIENINRVRKNKKKKHKYKLDDEMISNCKTAESDATEINQNNLNIEDDNRFYKEKKKHKCKLNDERENISDCKTAELDVIEINKNDLNSEDINRFYKKKKKRKLNDEKENISDCKTAELDVIEINKNHLNSEDIKRSYKEKKKHKRKLNDETENISDCKTAELDVIEINKNDLNSKDINRFYKKKKHKRKLNDERENISDSKTAELNVIEINKNDLNSEDIKRFYKEKKKHKHKLDDEIGVISNWKTAELGATEINQNDLNSEDVNRFFKKKKHKIHDKMENISDYKTAESIEINQNDLNSENANRFHKEKKKKHKLADEVESISHLKGKDSYVIGRSQKDLNKFHQKKKKKHGYKLFSEMENICNDSIEESAIDEAEKSIGFDTLDVHERNNCKSSDVDKISDYKTVDSNAIEINPDDLSNELHKAKRKKHGHNLAEVKNMPMTVIESNNTSNNVICCEYTKENGKKSIRKNSVTNKPPRRNKGNRELMESRNEMQSDNLKKEKKNVCCKEAEKNYQEGEDVYMSFGSCMNEWAEEPVPFLVPLLHEGETVASITPERKAYLEENGVTIHTGKWTKTEDNILTRNFQQFGLKFGINNPFQLLGINQNKKNDNFERFKKAKHFLVRLGKDLNNRSLRSIYMRARKLFSPLKNKEKLSTEETADLKHAHELVGNKWTRISEMLSRSDETCHTAFRWHKKEINKGKWTPEEENNLIKAIKTVSKAEDISANNLKNISWKAVAKYVPTRNEFQCHKQWAEHLAWDTSVSEKKRWKKYHYGKLIYLLKEKYCFNSEQEIDWRELHKHFKDVAPSYIFLHKKWYYLKGRLPKGFNSTYSKCLDAFYIMYEEEYKKLSDEKL